MTLASYFVYGHLTKRWTSQLVCTAACTRNPNGQKIRIRYTTVAVVQVFIMAMHVGGVIGAEGGGNGARHVSHSFSHCPPSASSKWSAMLVLVAVHSPLSDVAVESRGVANSLLTESESISGIAKRLKILLGILIQGRNHNTELV